MFCKQCGASVRDGVQFCPKCGARIPAENPQPTNQPRSPFVPAQPTAQRTFPSQQRAAQQPYGAAQPGNAQPPNGAAPYGAQSGGIDWERLQPRTRPAGATALIFAAALLLMGAAMLIWGATL